MNYGICGEYWLDGSSPLYADGDIGDIGHVGYVIKYCSRELADYFGIDLEWEDDIEREKEYILQNIMEDSDFINKYVPEGEDVYDYLNDDPKEAIIQYLIQEHNLNEKDANDLVFISFGNYSGDEREYAIDKWDWVTTVE